MPISLFRFLFLLASPGARPGAGPSGPGAAPGSSGASPGGPGAHPGGPGFPGNPGAGPGGPGASPRDRSRLLQLVCFGRQFGMFETEPWPIKRKRWCSLTKKRWCPLAEKR